MPPPSPPPSYIKELQNEKYKNKTKLSQKVNASCHYFVYNGDDTNYILK